FSYHAAATTQISTLSLHDALPISGANAWSVAASTAGPLLTSGRLTARYRQTKAAREEAALNYQQTALNAFREVSDALVSRTRFEDRKSTRLNSSHDQISYAVFCLK